MFVMPKHLITKLDIPESSLHMSPLRAIVLSQQYCIITVIWSIIGVSQYIDISIYHNTQEICIVSRYEMRIAIYRDFFIFLYPSSFSILPLTCRNCKVRNVHSFQI